MDGQKSDEFTLRNCTQKLMEANMIAFPAGVAAGYLPNPDFIQVVLTVIFFISGTFTVAFAILTIARAVFAFLKWWRPDLFENGRPL